MLDTYAADRQKLADDLLWGVDGPNGIAAFLGINPRRCYYLIDRQVIPVRKIGHRTITASRAELRRLFAGTAAA
jgi:hypothetical protein